MAEHPHAGKRVVGLLFAFDGYNEVPPHVIGVLPRGDMTRNVRRILQKTDSHMIVDTSLAGEPIYTMSIKDITNSLNENAEKVK